MTEEPSQQKMTSQATSQETEPMENLSEEMGMAELLEQQQSENQAQTDSQHSFLTAKVVSIVEEGVLVDIGKKSEALIPREEFEGPVPFAVGDSIPVSTNSYRSADGRPKVSWRAAREKLAWEHIEEAYKKKLPIQAKVKNEIKGGLLLNCENGLTGFMPASQTDLRPSHDLKKWKGQTVTAYIMEYDAHKNNLVLSRKLWLSEMNEKKKEETLSTLKTGDVKRGVVKSITSFGAFVDIGGIEGLLHIGELEWSHTKNVSSVLKVGQEIDVKIIKHDLETGKISLSRKAILPHPWENIEQKFSVGSIVEGRIVSITDFGAFVEIAPQIEGLIHASEISWKDFDQKPKNLLKKNDQVKVKIISVSREEEKISLSLKRTQESPWSSLQDQYQVGSAVEGMVSHLVPFGAFVRLPNGIEGLVHISDFSWTKRIRHPEDILKVGQTVTVKVLELDPEKEKLSFGLKQMKPNPYELYKKGMRVEGTITQITESGVTVEINPDVEAFVPRSEISSEKFDQPSDLCSVGSTVEAKVILSDSKERKLNLSIRQLEQELQRQAEKKYAGKNNQRKLGELFDSH